MLRPVGITILAKSPYVCIFCPGNPTQESNRNYHTARSGAGVFATGSMNWNFGLDAFGPYADERTAAHDGLHIPLPSR